MHGDRNKAVSNPGSAMHSLDLKHVVYISAAQFPEVAGSVLCRKHLRGEGGTPAIA